MSASIHENMNPAFLSAIAALAGSAVGGLTSFLSTWLGQSSQFRAQLVLNDKGGRQDLYREFVDQASQLYIHAMTHEEPDLSKAIILYALVSRMRIVSSHKVAEEAQSTARRIVDFYPQPNKSFAELVCMMETDTLDPLHDFAAACREELEGLNL
jgi:hypothetical protein